MSSLNEILREKAGSPLIAIDQGASVLDAVQMMNECSVGALIVKNAGQFSGIFTERDVLRRVLGKRLDPASVPVAQVMTERVICCTPATFDRRGPRADALAPRSAPADPRRRRRSRGRRLYR